MAELKTRATDRSVRAFLRSIDDVAKRADCLELVLMMEEVTEQKPTMWGDSIVGFGRYHYTYKSGREGDWFMAGFAPRKQNLTVYIMPGFAKYEPLLKKLGKHTHAKSCLYLKRLDDIDRIVLKELVADSVKQMQNMYDCE